jgi:hypothetical protein
VQFPQFGGYVRDQLGDRFTSGVILHCGPCPPAVDERGIAFVEDGRLQLRPLPR